MDIVDNGGHVLSTTTIDQTVTPSDFTDGGFAYKIVGTHTIHPATAIRDWTSSCGPPGAGGPAQMDAVRCYRTSADTSTKFANTDAVTFHLPDGYVATASGPVAGGSFAMDNRVGKPLTNFVEGPKSNEDGDQLRGRLRALPGLHQRRPTDPAQQPLADRDVYHLRRVGTADPPKNVQVVHGVTAQQFNYAQGGLGKGEDNCPEGKWTFIWDGDGTNIPSNVEARELRHDSYTVTEDLSYRNVGHATDNVRVYDIRLLLGSGVFSPSVQFRVTAGASVRRQLDHVAEEPDPTAQSGRPDGDHAWGAGGGRAPRPVPPQDPPKLWDRLEGMSCIRAMDALNTNGLVVSDFSDFKP